MNKIKVCHIITKLELGGAQRVTLYIAGNLNRSDFDVTLIAGKGGVLDEEYKNKPYVKFSRLCRQISPVVDFLTLIEIYKMLKKIKPDIVHTNSSKAGVIGRLAAKLAGVKHIVHTVHGFPFNEIYKNKFYVVLERMLAKITEKIITVTTEDTKKGLSHKIGNSPQYITIRAGIDISEFKNLPPPIGDKIIISTVGSFKPPKNIVDFIRAADIIHAKHPNTHFLVAGDGIMRPEIEKLIKGGFVTLLGWNNDIAGLLSKTRIFVMTTLIEGLPCAAVEALAAGKPVVAYAVDGLKEIIKNESNGFLVKPFDYVAIAQKVNYLIENPAIAGAMSESAALSISEEFDSKYMLNALETLYKEIMS